MKKKVIFSVIDGIIWSLFHYLSNTEHSAHFNVITSGGLNPLLCSCSCTAPDATGETHLLLNAVTEQRWKRAVEIVQSHPVINLDRPLCTSACTGPYSTTSPSTVIIPLGEYGSSLSARTLVYTRCWQLVVRCAPFSIARNSLSSAVGDIPALT